MSEHRELLTYTESNYDTVISATTEATANIIATLEFIADGISTYEVEFYTPYVQPGYVAESRIVIVKYLDGAPSLEALPLAVVWKATSGVLKVPVTKRYRITPSAGLHAVSIRAYRIAANGIVGGAPSDIDPLGAESGTVGDGHGFIAIYVVRDP